MSRCHEGVAKGPSKATRHMSITYLWLWIFCKTSYFKQPNRGVYGRKGLKNKKTECEADWLSWRSFPDPIEVGTQGVDTGFFRDPAPLTISGKVRSSSLSPFSARYPPSAFLSAFFPSRLPQGWSISSTYSTGGFPNCSTFLPHKGTKALTTMLSGWSKQWSHFLVHQFLDVPFPSLLRQNIQPEIYWRKDLCWLTVRDTRQHCRDSRETVLAHS